jgi:hypothetical protein
MPKGKGIEWSPEEDDLWLELLLERVHNGTIVRGIVNQKTWVELTNKMNVRATRVFNPSQLSSKYTRFRKDHKDFSGLLNHETDFGWDPILNILSGTLTQWERAKMVCSIPYDLSVINLLYKSWKTTNVN